MKSLGAAVRISNGNPPAARMAFLSSAARPSRWLKQLDSSDDELTMAIFGFAMSASERPSARHCAMRPAQSGVPGSRLLRSLRGTHGLLRDGAEEGAVALQPLLERADVDFSRRQTIRECQIGGRTRSLAHDKARPRDARRRLAFVGHRRAAPGDEEVLDPLRHDDAVRDLIEAA